MIQEKFLATSENWLTPLQYEKPTNDKEYFQWVYDHNQEGLPLVRIDGFTLIPEKVYIRDFQSLRSEGVEAAWVSCDLSAYETTGDKTRRIVYSLVENHLPSAAQIGDKVFLFYQNQKLDAVVIGVHFIREAVKYDVELTFGSVKWDKQVKTRIYNIQSGFVSKDPANLPVNEDLQSAMEDMGQSIKRLADGSLAHHDLTVDWENLKKELLA
jgi:hypothetical protein